MKKSSTWPKLPSASALRAICTMCSDTRLSVITLKSELAGKLIDRDPERAGKEIREVEEISRQALSDVRDAIRGYRSKGLVAELAQAKTTLETAGLAVQCDAATTIKLPAVQESVLSLAVREAVTNVVRHAQARTCRLRLEQQNGTCHWKLKTMAQGFPTIEGNGLRGMRERVEMLGGTLDRSTEAGTTLIITLPLKEVVLRTRRTSTRESLAKESSHENPRKKAARPSAWFWPKIRAWCWARWLRCLKSKATSPWSRKARNGKEALEAVLAHKPDVFITDIEMPHMSGLDVAAELKRRKTGTRVVIVTTFARAGYLRRALDAGASGYLLKDMRAEELADAVRRVHQGLRVIHPELATEAWARNGSAHRPRTPGVATGRRRHGQRRYRQRIGTCPTARCEIIFPKRSARLGASNRVEAARIARTKGWL